jgi:hypothetical protein
MHHPIWEKIRFQGFCRICVRALTWKAIFGRCQTATPASRREAVYLSVQFRLPAAFRFGRPPAGPEVLVTSATMAFVRQSAAMNSAP